MKNRSVPTDILLPHIVYQDVAAAILWLSETFGLASTIVMGNLLAAPRSIWVALMSCCMARGRGAPAPLKWAAARNH